MKPIGLTRSISRLDVFELATFRVSLDNRNHTTISRTKLVLTVVFVLAMNSPPGLMTVLENSAFTILTEAALTSHSHR